MYIYLKSSVTLALLIVGQFINKIAMPLPDPAESLRDCNAFPAAVTRRSISVPPRPLPASCVIVFIPSQCSCMTPKKVESASIEIRAWGLFGITSSSSSSRYSLTMPVTERRGRLEPITRGDRRANYTTDVGREQSVTDLLCSTYWQEMHQAFVVRNARALLISFPISWNPNFELCVP